MAKKISLFLCSVIMLLMLPIVGCSDNTDVKDNGKINIVTTIFPQYDFTREIVGDYANLNLLIPPGGESHTYEPTPKDVISVEEADVFLYIGGESEKWVEKILASVNTKDMQIVKLIDCVETVCIKEEDTHNHSGEEHHHSIDEHIWTSPLNAIKMVNTICDAICKADNSNQTIYTNNAKDYIEKLNKLDTTFKEIVVNSQKKELVFGDRFPLIYFTQEYGLKYYSAFPGCSTETEPSASTLAWLSKKIKEESVPVVLKIELSNSTVADTLASETNTKVMTFYSCHNLTKEQFDNGENYISMMNKNIETLKIALIYNGVD
ncbi:MAG: metal ABC transporter substrate-binding protein [Acutalibacteraceae bacterium]